MLGAANVFHINTEYKSVKPPIGLKDPLVKYLTPMIIGFSGLRRASIFQAVIY